MSAYIEIDYATSDPPFTNPQKIFSLAEGSFSLDKDYEVFDALAWGRSSQYEEEDRDPSSVPLISPRGMPSPCSTEAAQEYFRLVADPPAVPDRHFWPPWACVSSVEADRWVSEENCQEASILQWFNCPADGIVWRMVSQPHFYNASWLRADEFDAALKHQNLELPRLPVKYRIIRNALTLLEEEHGASRVRLVIWFS